MCAPIILSISVYVCIFLVYVMLSMAYWYFIKHANALSGIAKSCSTCVNATTTTKITLLAKNLQHLCTNEELNITHAKNDTYNAHTYICTLQSDRIDQ